MKEDKKKHEIDGTRLDYIGMNYHLYGCADPDSPPIENREEFEAFMEQIRPKLTGVGRPLIMGVGGEIEKGNFFKLWEESEKK